MSDYYNEFDPYVAQWLRNLIAAGLIPDGVVDESDIRDVNPAYLMQFRRCHFFAGLGGWPLALQLAGVPDSERLWTGSCPCQPFSVAGRGLGFADERHLWPHWHWLIEQCRPAKIYGEQVASKAAEPWIDLVHADLEGLGYAFGCVAFPSAGVGAPCVRDRAYWMARALHPEGEGFGPIGVPVDPERAANEPGPGDFWKTDAVIRCADGRTRPIKSSIQPLAPGYPGRCGELRALGNAINVEQARIFIESCM
jgi:DNA (cytosine-5)-methyltransferase 1